MSAIMVIAGGAWQCPIVKLAKKMGHYVICSNLYEDSPAFKYADTAIVANVLDKERNLELARRYKPDAVLTDQSDIAVPTVAYIADYLGLKGIGIKTAEKFTNKFKMRECAESAGFKTPKYCLCNSKKDAKMFLSKCPVSIIKPLDSQSSRGIHIVRTDEEIDQYYEDCIQYSNIRKSILIEEYIDGTEFTVDGLKTTREYIVTAISEKEHYSFSPTVAKRLLFTQDNDKYDYDRLRKINAELIEAMGLSFGLTHTEYKYRDGEFYLIETAARGGGTKISSDIVPLVSGINSNEIYLNILTGGTDEIVRNPHHECAVLGFFDFKPGRIVDIKGVEEAMSIDGVVDLKIETGIGNMLGFPQDDRSRCGYYIIFADSVKELNEREIALKTIVKVVTE